MNQQQSYLALDWVKDALDETLIAARKIVAQAKTVPDLVGLTPLLHQVSGTLHMTQLAEPLVLAETLEQLSHAISDGQVGLQVLPELTLGIDLLKDELSQMQRTKRGHSIAIYRMVNHFRPLLARDPLKQREWLKPDLSLVLESQWHADPMDRHNRLLLAQAMRFHLKNILDRRAVAADWQAVVRVASYMSQGAATLQQAALWHVVHTLYNEVAIAYAEGQHAELDVQYLLVRLERLLTHGLDDDTVLADSLLQLGQRRVVKTLEAKRLRQVFGLASHFEAGMTPRLLETVKQAVHAAHTILVQSPASAQVSLQEAERLLNITGWTALADQVSMILHQLKQSVSSQHLQRVQAELAQIELTLAETILVTTAASADAAPDVLDDARHAAVRESRAALESAKDALSAYHVSRWDASTLAELPEHLTQVRGVFVILGLSRPAALLDRLAELVSQTVLVQGFEPNWRQVGLLAEAISAIEYYSDQLAGHYQDDSVLDQAELALTAFERPLTSAAPERVGGEKLYHDETPLAVLVEAEKPPVSTAEVAAPTTSVATTALSAAALLVELPEDDFDQDDEIRDIFIEEAEEVLESIQEFFPKWAADFADIAALKEFRRAFHTLKGSGRMVGARVVGELAWSVESLLNRVLDQSVLPNEAMVALITQVIEMVPVLVQDYADGHVASQDPRTLISVAQALAKGEIPSAPAADVATDVTVAVATTAATLDPVAVDTATTDTIEMSTAEPVSSSAAIPASVSAAVDVVAAAPSVQAVSVVLPLVPTDSFDQDEEIREIFIEEVEEVLEAIAEFFPQWSADFSNIAALKEFRRGFHTLKGSGRMVGARVMGELAWSIENMLNRVLDHSIQPDAEMVELITDVLACVTPLVDDFKHARAPSIDTAPLMYCANERTAGRVVTLADLTVSPPASTDQQAEVSEPVPQQLVPATLTSSLDIHQVESASASLEDEPNAFDDLADALTQELADLPEQEDSSEFDMDPQLLEIFISEADGYLSDIQNFIQHYPEPAEVTDVLLRAVHTLRGSAGMSGVDSIYRMAMAMESECKRLMRDHQPMQAAHIELLQQLVLHVQHHLDYVQRYSRSEPLRTEDHVLIDQILTAERGLSSVDEPEETRVVGLVSQLMALEIDDILDAEWELENQLASEQCADYIAAMATQSHGLMVATAQMPVPALHQLATSLHQVYATLTTQLELRDDLQLVELLGNAHAALTRMFDAMAGSQKVPTEQEALQKIANWIAENTSATAAESVPASVPVQIAVLPSVPAVTSAPSLDSQNDPELLEIFLEEAEELVQEIDQQFNEWASDPSAIAPLMVLQRNLHTLKGGARMARVESLGDFGHELETVYEQLVSGRLQASSDLVRFMRHAQDQIARQIDQLMQQGTSFHCPQELATLHQYLAGQPQALSDFFSTAAVGSIKPASAVSANAAAESVAASPAASAVAPIAVQPTAVTAPTIQPPAVPVLRQMQVLAQAWDEGNAPDPEMLEIFLDEAAEIVDHTSTQLAVWQRDPQQTEALKELQRGLHTLKGGARMAGVESLGDLAHEMEFVYEDLALGKKASSSLLGQLLAQCHDWLADAIAVLDRGEKPQYPQPLVDALRDFMRQPSSLVALPSLTLTEVPLQAGSQFVSVADVSHVDTAHEPPPMQGLFANRSGQDQASNEMIRVSAGLMENMINLSGESAINRARIEMGTTTLGMTIEEMGATVQRLVDQLRRMEGELETQILARHQGEMGKYEDFDPLEMDQYSALNQLSKSLSESASDLFDFKATLLEKVRDTEGLLLQQSRLQSELQEGLMKSRLVPFSRLVPRLQRIVRQTSTELGKPAELIVQNAEGELDRTVLERMIAPLEHMLRNAVDHGIETPEQRRAAIKPPMGKIILNVAREGGEIAITLQDDGRGINVDAVRRKAIERGLLAADAVISDVEIMQFIFHAGLSTAQAVTQISGRGVGMDVVQSEIKLLGGNVSVDSTAGRGSVFSVRLPLTVSVTDALMVRVADRMFAVPLVQIDRIVRVSPAELSKLYRQDDSQYVFESNSYRLRYLGEFIQGNRVPVLDHQVSTVPLLLIRQAGQLLAIQVDQLIGSRVEIVVKPVGQQLASVSAVSGATILGDGSVMIILDMVALARQAASNLRRDAAATASEKRKTQTTVMVVDDSVTVRKVTTRLLERQGYAVLTAKDGVDAIAKLEDVTPDIMLLDIEMPRMDGFEVATLVRHNPRIKDLPIIMITSRTGEKHRERAFQIGVSCYMGKPFQEQELLENIHELLGVLSE